MSRQRKQIRKTVVSLLKGKTGAGENVTANRTIPPWNQDLPAILIYPRSETSEEWAQAPRELKRIFQMAVEIVESRPTDEELSDSLDDLADQVERILSADDSLAMTVEDIILNSVEFEYVADGEKPIGSARLIYSVTYLKGAPEDRFDQTETDFKSANVDWQVGHNDEPPDDQIEAQDTIDIPPP